MRKASKYLLSFILDTSNIQPIDYLVTTMPFTHKKNNIHSFKYNYIYINISYKLFKCLQHMWSCSSSCQHVYMVPELHNFVTETNFMERLLMLLYRHTNTFPTCFHNSVTCTDCTDIHIFSFPLTLMILNNN